MKKKIFFVLIVAEDLVRIRIRIRTYCHESGNWAKRLVISVKVYPEM
jgi:hypothetical protein